jgi:hypothetical protein
MKKAKTVESILDQALANLSVINSPTYARQLNIKLAKVDLEEQHWVHQCTIIKIFKDSTKAPERKVASAFGISKTEINRMMQIMTVGSAVRLAAYKNNCEKYVLVVLSKIKAGKVKDKIINGVLDGSITKYSQVKGMK